MSRLHPSKRNTNTYHCPYLGTVPVAVEAGAELVVVDVIGVVVVEVVVEVVVVLAAVLVVTGFVTLAAWFPRKVARSAAMYW